MSQPPHTSDITTLLQGAQAGHADSQQRLAEAVYGHLRRIADSQMRKERSGHTLQPTALVNEAYIRLFSNQQMQWENRSHFFAIAANQMRRILIDHSRSHNAAKREGIRLELQDADAEVTPGRFEFGVVEELLERLQSLDPQAARVVELKIYAGFTDDEVARLVGVPKSKIRADWAFAKSWLAARLRPAAEKKLRQL